MLSICVALKNRSRVIVDGRQLRLFPNCVESVTRSALHETELVVADWDSDDWPLDQWLPKAAGTLKLRIVKMDGSFSRGCGRNVAARAAKGDVLFFTDADCLLCRELLQRGTQLLREGKSFFPVLYSFNGPEHRDGWWRHSGFGNCMVTRENYEKTGGWPEYNQWGKEDEHFFERVSAVSEVVREEIPGFYHQWHPEDILWKDRFVERDPAAIDEILQTRKAAEELASVVPPGNDLVLVDEARFGIDRLEGRKVFPFIEVNGEYGGAPSDDMMAISELERLRAAGATFVAFAWMAFWWLDHYAGLRQYLTSSFPLVLQNERVIVFDLRQGPRPVVPGASAWGKND